MTFLSLNLRCLFLSFVCVSSVSRLSSLRCRLLLRLLTLLPSSLRDRLSSASPAGSAPACAVSVLGSLVTLSRGPPLSGLCRTLTLSEGSHPQPKLSPKPDARVQPPAPPSLAVPWACSPGQTQCLPRPDHTPSSVASHPRQAAPAGGEPGSPAGLSGSLPRKRPRSGPATSLPDCCRGPRRSPHSRPDSGPGSAACCSDDCGASHTPRPLVPLRSTQVGRRI